MKQGISQVLVVAGLALANLPLMDASEGADFGIFEWIHNAPGGFYHPDQDFRPDPETGAMGVFAGRDIPEGTILVKVPWTHLIKSDDPTEEGQLCCGTVDSLARELRKGEDSEYAPYIKYLQNQAENQIPSGWSDEGKAFLQDIVGGKDAESQVLPPEDPSKWLVDDWYTRCEGDPEDKIGIKAALLVIQRSDDHILIPAYDMYNHRNGEHLNTETIMTPDINHVTVATRNIKAGEQINISYNRCRGCIGRTHFYGTGEILRDYGFVEFMPQIWYYKNKYTTIQFDLDIDENGELELEWDDSLSPPPTVKDRNVFAGFLRGEIRRLERLYNIKYRDGNPGMPDLEWETCERFILANIRAMSAAITSLEEMNGLTQFKTFEYEKHQPHYDTLENEVDDLSYIDETCNNARILNFPGHSEVDYLDTHYQELKFEIHPKTKDVMMALDGVTQIASVYRPQYHEYSVHAAARYLDSMKRVIFIGGGDSMLLHEILKYPELELVVGLELDQIVTRKSFKYFHTQPHFDDPRVEWWFGDATKSLLLLPEDYWQSFDLVLVDLSETVMSLSVTGELDVFDALALLLKPEGVLVKNEIYMEAISQVFDHTVQICYQSPVICDQVLTMGSHKVDFMHAPVKDHGIPTLLYEPMTSSSNRHDFLHDYRQNNATEQGKCGGLPKSSGSQEKEKSAGIMEVIEAEEVSVPLDESLVAVFEEKISSLGFSVSSDSVFDDGTIMILMKEGYVIAHTIPEKKYCNLDINLWGRFHKLKELSSSLKMALGSKTVSSFRVVVGGMYGSSSWNDDKAMIGPQIVQNRDCEVPHPDKKKANKKAPSQEDLITAAVTQFVDKNWESSSGKLLGVAICGLQEKECLAASILKSSNVVGHSFSLSTCDDMDSSTPNTLYDCEITIMNELKALTEKKGTIDLLLIDGDASFEMLQILSSIMDEDSIRESLMKGEKNAVVTWSMNGKAESYRRNFLDRYRKQHQDDPVSRGLFSLDAEGNGAAPVEFGIVSAGDDSAAYTFASIESNVRETYKKTKGVVAELTSIHGGKYAWWDPWEPKEFLPSDYDNEPGLKQYFEQECLAQHAMLQFEPVEGSQFSFTKESLNKALQSSLQKVGFECRNKFLVDDIGDGYLMVCLNPEEGSVILTYDGREHVDISYYLADDDEDEIDRFTAWFAYETDGELSLALRDEMPRGTGRVVNFQEDMMTPEDHTEFLENLQPPRGYSQWLDAAKSHASPDAEYGERKKVEEGTCSGSGADDHSCWPVPPS